MDTPAEFSVDQTDQGGRAVLTGDWTAVSLGDAGGQLSQALAEGRLEPATTAQLAESAAHMVEAVRHQEGGFFAAARPMYRASSSSDACRTNAELPNSFSSFRTVISPIPGI